MDHPIHTRNALTPLAPSTPLLSPLRRRRLHLPAGTAALVGDSLGHWGHPLRAGDCYPCGLALQRPIAPLQGTLATASRPFAWGLARVDRPCMGLGRGQPPL
ncbi:hypothetical protein B296_00004551 [Ensete ventricosum]|uniref:Uncharacterized protein n=1 Tax=Ensete ventricosum TaxID=4639 RepID=A0A427APT6_ENSVE|nr:hypothetical protein B296_00004551 [Ensete ventricosum]